jgi:spore germination protein YaaH
MVGLAIGVAGFVFALDYYAKSSPEAEKFLSPLGLDRPEAIGFLPYWLIDKERQDYFSNLDEIGYFGLTIDEDGTIMKRTNPTETEPGWLMMQSKKISSILDTAEEKKLKRSLVIFSGDQETIDLLIADPVKHAKNLIKDISPLIDKHKFSGVNIDIESVTTASESARQNFTTFMKTVDEELNRKNETIELSIDVSPTAMLKPYLINVEAISRYVDKVIFMTYDFHYPGSSVTGAVAPNGGAGITAEFDTETSIKLALIILEPKKIILGVPLYGYEWETLTDHPSAAVIPGSGITSSNMRVEKLLSECATCSAQFDPIAQESYLIYKDQETNTFHQFFYPDKRAIAEKVKLVKKYKIGGLALWALGYEGKTILEPLNGL